MSLKYPRVGRAVSIIATLAVPFASTAQTYAEASTAICRAPPDGEHAAEPAARITLALALKSVRQTAPAVRVAALEAVAAHHDANQARRFRNPVLSAETENFAGSAPFGGFDGVESTFTISQTIRLGDKRRLEHRAAQARAAVADSDRFVILRAAELEVGSRFYELSAAVAAAEASRENLKISENFEGAVSRRVDLGKSPPSDRARAVTALAIARGAAAQADALVESTRFSLAQLWGETTPTFDNPVTKLESLGDLVAGADVGDLISKHPRLRAARAREVARAAALLYSRSNAYPDLTVGLGVRRFEIAGDALVANISVPLPFFDRNQDSIKAAGARVDSADASVFAARTRLAAELGQTLARAHGAELRLEALRDEALPAAIEAERVTRQGYEAGKFNLTTVLDARTALINVRLQAIRAGLAARLAELEARALANLAPFDTSGCPGS